jgi:predicted RNA-binding protein with TRAM domain
LSSWHGLKEGDEVELEIKEKARDGRGVARLRGCIIFVEGASVGEKVRVRISRLAARHVHAQVVKRLAK